MSYLNENQIDKIEDLLSQICDVADFDRDKQDLIRETIGVCIEQRSDELRCEFDKD